MINVYVDSICQAIDQQNWYAALAFALTLPDICGSVEQPDELSSKKRFVDWYNKYVTPKFQDVFSDGVGSLLLSGADCYALRCSFLHNGSGDITSQRAQEILETFYFIEPLKNWSVNTRTRGTMLIIQVDRFCLLICSAVNDWLSGKVDLAASGQPFLTIWNLKTDGMPL